MPPLCRRLLARDAGPLAWVTLQRASMKFFGTVRAEWMTGTRNMRRELPWTVYPLPPHEGIDA